MFLSQSISDKIYISKSSVMILEYIKCKIVVNKKPGIILRYRVNVPTAVKIQEK